MLAQLRGWSGGMESKQYLSKNTIGLSCAARETTGISARSTRVNVLTTTCNTSRIYATRCDIERYDRKFGIVSRVEAQPLAHWQDGFPAIATA